MTRRAALSLLLLCAQTAAADCSAVVGGWSAHFESRNEYGEEWNESHSAMGLSCGGWSAMRMTNSYGDPTVALGHEWTLRQHGRWSAGAYLGAWTGYRPAVEAIPALTVGYTARRVGLSAMLLPNAAAVFVRVRL